jgi:molybdate transport system substrate-binding protein
MAAIVELALPQKTVQFQKQAAIGTYWRSARYFGGPATARESCAGRCIGGDGRGMNGTRRGAASIAADKRGIGAVPSEIKVLSSTAMKTSMDVLMPRFERASGHTVAFAYGPSVRITGQVADGEANDVTIVTDKGIDELIRKGRIAAGSRADIARSAMALAVQKGAPKPDISTPEAFKQAMLAAKSLAMSNPVGGGASGAILMRIFDQLGITDTMKPKLTFGPGGPAGLIGNFLVRKEVEIGIQQMPELLAVPGIDIVGPLPFGNETVSVFSAGLSTGARDADAARALIAFLASPEAAAAIRGNGMEAG